MIKLPTRPDCPPVLNRQKVKNALDALVTKVEQGNKLSEKDFKGKRYWGETKQSLSDYQNGKCCFCERHRDANPESDVEHFRPKLGVTGEDHPGYWWLAYVWSNLLFSCKACNSTYKKNHFPLVNKTSRVSVKGRDLSLEKPMLINPSFEDPADFIDYDWDSDQDKVFVVGKDPENRGSETIRILGLDLRDDLHQGRLELVLTLRLVYDTVQEFSPHHEYYKDAIRILRHKTKPYQGYLGLTHCYIRRKGLEKFLDD